MLYIDSHESIELELLLSQSLPVTRDHLNDAGKADLFWLGYGGKQVQVELKQAGEALGSLDSVEEQLGREMAAGDYLALGIRGIVTPTPEGFCQTWTPSAKNPQIIFRDREYRQQYVGYRAWLDRLQMLGVLVVEVPTIEALAITITAMFNQSQKAESEHRTFERLVPEKYWIKEADQPKRDFALSLMGIRGARVGEEIALALAERFPSIATLVNTLEGGADTEVAKLPLRHAKRTIGPAAVSRLKAALGL